MKNVFKLAFIVCNHDGGGRESQWTEGQGLACERKANPSVADYFGPRFFSAGQKAALGLIFGP